MSGTAQYINPRTGARWPTDRPLWRAPDDNGYLNLTVGDGLTPDEIDRGEHSLWRYRAALRLAAPPQITLGAGWTPLLRCEWDGAPVRMKADYLMASGSFKDRGIAVMMNYLKQAGVTSVMGDSSGNAGASASV